MILLQKTLKVPDRREKKLMDLPASKLRIPAHKGGHRQRQHTGRTVQMRLTSGYDLEHPGTLTEQ